MKTEIEIQKENFQSLLDLIKKYPDLKVVPMVDSQIVADDGYCSWQGSFGKAAVDYIWNNGERIYFKLQDEDDLVEEIMETIPEEIDDETAEKTARALVEKYEWEEVITVYIGLP